MLLFFGFTYVIIHIKELIKLAYSPKSQLKYDKANTVHIGIKLNKKTDAELLEKIEQLVEQGYSKQGAIKYLMGITKE